MKLDPLSVPINLSALHFGAYRRIQRAPSFSGQLKIGVKIESVT